MKMWFPLMMVLAYAAIGTPLQAGIFDRLVNESEESVALNGGGHVHAGPEFHAPVYSDNHSVHGPVQMSPGYPFQTGCCETQNPCIAGLWKGYCSRAHGACDRMQSWFTGCARSHGKGGCASGHCGGKGSCATGNCGHAGFGKSFGHVQHGGSVHQKSHVQRSHVQRTHVQRTHVQRTHVQRGYGKGFSGCGTCGQAPCRCSGSKGHHQKGHYQKGFGLSLRAPTCGSKGHALGNCGCGVSQHGKAVHGKGLKARTGFFDRMHRCHTCGKSKGHGFGGCDCGGSTAIQSWGGKGWGGNGEIIWDKSHSYEVPHHGQPTPAYEPPVELEIPEPTDDLPVPSTPTAHSASMRRLPPVAGYAY